MHTTVSYVVSDPEARFEEHCFSLCQALAIAHAHDLDPATAISISADFRRQSVVFQNMDEVIGDLLRNRAMRYRVTVWSDDGSGRVEQTLVYPSASRGLVIEWLIRHLFRYELMTYIYDRSTNHGRYNCTGSVSGFNEGVWIVEEIT